MTLLHFRLPTEGKLVAILVYSPFMRVSTSEYQKISRALIAASQLFELIEKAE